MKKVTTILTTNAIGIAHWYAAKGAKDGKSYGVVISRIIGTLWLIGFPIGTALA